MTSRVSVGSRQHVGGLVKRFGLADLLGIVGALVALAWLPGSADPLTYVKLLMLLAGGLAVGPAVFVR